MGRTIKVGGDGLTLDLTGLMGEPAKNEPPEGGYNGEELGERYNYYAEAQEPPEAPEKAVNGEQAASLLREHDRIATKKQNALMVYRAYQENIIKSERLQNEILRGVRAGEDIYSLFVKAARAVSLMTDDLVYYDQLKAATQAAYGAEVEDEDRGGAERGPADEKSIAAAIQAHRKRIAELEDLIK